MVTSARDDSGHGDPAQGDLQRANRSAPQGALSPQHRAILEFERQPWRHPTAKEESIKAEFGVSAIRYYQMLNVVLDDPAALAFDPILVKRLRRLRETGHPTGHSDHPDRG